MSLAHSEAGASDLVLLDELSEDAIYNTLSKRLAFGKIYVSLFFGFKRHWALLSRE